MRRSLSCCPPTSQDSSELGLQSLHPASPWLVPVGLPGHDGTMRGAAPQSSRADFVAGLRKGLLPSPNYETSYELMRGKHTARVASCGKTAQLLEREHAADALAQVVPQSKPAAARIKPNLRSKAPLWPLQRLPKARRLWAESDLDPGAAMDVDCCGDSGATSYICSPAPHNSRLIARATSVHSNDSHTHQLSHPDHCAHVHSPAHTALSDRRSSEESMDNNDLPMALTPRMPHAGSSLDHDQALMQLLFRLNHARQTVDYVQRQVAIFKRLSKGSLSVWDALDKLSMVKEPGCGADAPTLTQQALHLAEACRSAHPQQGWLHLVGLIHGLGKLLAHPSFGPQPDWAVFSESFPVGCLFHPNITCSQFFSVNPDRRRRLYNTATGMYAPFCGLSALRMSWTAYEYLYQVLLLNKTLLPASAMFILRYCNFQSVTMPGQAYDELLSEADETMLPWLYRFQSLKAASSEVNVRSNPTTLDSSLKAYYSMLIAKYIPGSIIQF